MIGEFVVSVSGMAVTPRSGEGLTMLGPMAGWANEKGRPEGRPFR